MTAVTTVKIPVKATIADHDTAPGIVNGVAEGDRIDVKMGGVLVASLAASSIDTAASLGLLAGGLTVLARPAFVAYAAGNIPDAVVGVPYTQLVSVTNNTGAHNDDSYDVVVNVDSDPVPDGMDFPDVITSGAYHIGGTPTTPGNAEVILDIVSTSGRVTGQLSLGITVVAAPIPQKPIRTALFNALVTTAGAEVVGSDVALPATNAAEYMIEVACAAVVATPVNSIVIEGNNAGIYTTLATLTPAPNTASSTLIAVADTDGYTHLRARCTVTGALAQERIIIDIITQGDDA